MTFEFKFADIGEGIHEGEIIQWHIRPGDQVKRDQLIVEVMTEKVAVEITAPVPGKVDNLKFEPGDIVKVGDIMFTIDESNLVQNSTSKDQSSTSSSTSTKEKDDSLFVASDRVRRKRRVDDSLKSSRHVDKKSSSPAPEQIINERPLASPAIRREAREKSINLKYVRGTGSGGRITREDFKIYLQQGVSGPPITDYTPIAPKQLSVPLGDEKRIPVKGIRRAISENMAKSKRTASHFSYFDEFDMTGLEKLRNEARRYAEKNGINVKVTYLPFIIKAVTRALMEHPTLNASMDDEKQEIILKGYYNIGIAVDTENGLMVPVIKDTNQKSIWQLSSEIQDLATRARTGKLKLDEITGGTFTLTNVGPIGGLMSTPIINHPEVGIIGIHKGKLRPVVIEDSGKPEIAIRRMMFLSISVDHRVTDGANAARFMNQIINYLETPASMFLDVM